MKRGEILARIPQDPFVSSLASEALKKIQDVNADIKEITRLIENHPSLAANVLRIANSSLFGGSRQTKTVREAIVRLGTKELLRLVVASTIGPKLQKSVSGYDLPPFELWKHSLATACAVKEIACLLNKEFPEEILTAALLLDLGKTVLGEFIEIDAQKIIQKAQEAQISFDEAERQVLGIDHAELGAIILEKWGFPEDLIRYVRWHHLPEKFEGPAGAIDLLHLADHFSLMCGIGMGNEGSLYQASPEVLSKYNFKPSQIEKIVNEMLNGLDEMADLFEGLEEGDHV